MKRAPLTLLGFGSALLGVGVFLACDRGSLDRAKKHLEAVGLHVETESEENESEEGEAQALVAAHDWWIGQRAFPGGIPAQAQMQGAVAFDGITRLPAQRPHPGLHADPPPPPPAWQLVGPSVVHPGNILPSISVSAGRVNALAVDPSAPKTIYAGTSYGGIWKTLDAGVTWTAVADNMPSLSIGAIAIDPANPQIVYAGTGEGSNGYAGVGLYRSTDGGGTWQVLGATELGGYGATRIVVDSPSGFIYVSTEQGIAGTGDFCGNLAGAGVGSGLWRSKDAGATWEHLVKQGGVFDFNIDPTSNPRKILVSRDGQSAGLYDEATSTATTIAGLPIISATYSFARAPSDPKIIWVGPSGKSGSTPNLLRSTDNGVTWTTVAAPPYCTGQCSYDNIISIDPTDANRVWLGGSSCSAWLATDAMTATPTWIPVSLPSKTCVTTFTPNGPQVNWPSAATHPDAHALLWVGTDLYFGTDGGITRTKDGGQTWEQLSQGMATLQYYNICILESDPNFYMAAAQDNGMQYAQPDGTFTVGTNGDGANCALASATKGVVMLDQGIVFKWTGTHGGGTAFDASPTCNPNSGIPGCGDRALFIPPMTTDPSAPTTAFLGTQRLWRSTNSGSNWTAISPDLTYGGTGEQCFGGKTADILSAIGVAASAGNTIYTGSSGGRIQATFDGGGTWASVSTGIPKRYVTGLAVDPKNDKVVYASFSGFSVNTAEKGHLFKSTDGGTTWAARDIPMDSPADTVTTHPTRSDIAFVGTDYGVLATSDGGATWSPIADGLPRAPSLSIKYRQVDDTLVVGTYGRGIWKLPLAGTLGAAPAMTTLTAVVGQKSAPTNIVVSSSSVYGSEIAFTATTAVPWMTVTPAAPAAANPVDVTVVGDAATLAVGEYDAKMTIAPAAGTPIDIAVHFSVTSDTTGAGGAAGGAPGTGGTGGQTTVGTGGSATGGSSATGAGGTPAGGTPGAGGKSGGGGTTLAFGAGGQLAFGAGGQPTTPQASPQSDDSSGGCGCEVTGTRSWTTPALAVFALLVASRRRRRSKR